MCELMITIHLHRTIEYTEKSSITWAILLEDLIHFYKVKNFCESHKNEKSETQSRRRPV